MERLKSTVAALVLLVMLPVTAYAINVSAGTEGEAGVEVGTGGSASAGVGIGATSSTEAGASSSGSGTNDVVVGVPERVEVIVVTRADVEAGSAARASASPSSVSVEGDLSGFVAAQIVSDENLAKVESSRDRVSVTYPQRARLFGIIPLTVNATATVNADGTVDVSYPWYAFLMVTNEASLESDIEGRIGAPDLSANTEASADLALTANAQAQLIDEVRAAMEASLSADASGTVEL